jgi:hypothetical protein
MLTSKVKYGVMALVVAGLMTTGCKFAFISGTEFGPATVPVPIPAYIQKRREDQFWVQERYNRVPILGPITHGGPVQALDPPSDDEVMRAMPSIEGGIPFLWERSRNNIIITKELMCDRIDPPRVYPLIGPAQLHHAHYKCTVYYSETTRHGWPIPYTTVDEDAVEVIYIDHDHLHMVEDHKPMPVR